MKRSKSFILFILLPTALAGYLSIAPPQNDSLRSSPKKVSVNEAKQMLQQNGFFDKYWNPTGGDTKKFKTETVNQDNILIDSKTGLMWYPSGSQKFVTAEGAEEWISNLNTRGYAGYFDWRLPTLEEAASLLENKKRNNFYLNPSFDRRQWCVWTCDSLDAEFNWMVAFSGRLDWLDRKISLGYVRPVRNI
ncbi:DUF1566 domain-containing protein [Acidobacteriota bacterium]